MLYLTDPVDEAMVTNMAKFGEHELVDVSKEGLKLNDSDEDAKKSEATAKEFQGVVDFLKQALGEKVEKVSVSDRLTDSPCALVTSKFGWSANMERIMKGQVVLGVVVKGRSEGRGGRRGGKVGAQTCSAL